MSAKNKQLLSMIFLLGIACSCEKEIPYTGSDSESLMVVNQLIEKDSTFSIGIERSKFFLDNSSGSTLLNDASVVLKNTTTGTSEEQTVGNNGLYSFNMIAQEGHSYEVAASHTDFPSTSANTTIPVSVDLISVDTLSFDDPDNGTMMEAKLKWNDPAGKNYYIVAVRSEAFSESVFLRSSDVSIANNGANFEGDPTYAYFFALNDDTFDGTEKQLVLDFENFGTPTGVPSQFHYQLLNCTEDTYKYLISVNTNLNSGGGDPFTEPVKVHTNIEGGYGIFSGMNKSQITQ